jgi:hypothetical protein
MMTAYVARTVTAFFIVRTILSIVNNIVPDRDRTKSLPNVSQFYMFITSVIIMGPPYILLLIISLTPYSPDYLSASSVNYLLDILRLFLLVVVVSRKYNKEIKEVKVQLRNS